MTIYYKFKSARDYDTISMDDLHFISVASLKEKICEAKQLGGGNDDIVISNVHTNEDYLDEESLIPKNTSVLIRRVPTLQQKYISRSITAKADEETKLKALLDTPPLDWHQKKQGRDYRLGMSGRGFGTERKTPYEGYICHRCGQPGHFIHHCPTNSDPKYDFKRDKPSSDIPNSMLMDVSSSLPNGANADAFEREMEEGLLPSTTRSVAEIAGSRFQVQDMPVGPGLSSQYFNGVQPGFNYGQPGFHYGVSHAFRVPYPGVVTPSFGYGLRPMDMSFGSVMHPYPFTTQGFGFPNNIPPPPPPPHRAGNVMREGESSRMMSSSYSATSSSHVKPESRRELPAPATYYNPPRSSSRRFEHDSEHDRRRNRHDDDDDDKDRHFKSKRSRR